MKKILLTGACGRIGSRLGEQLLEEGNEVIGLDLVPARTSHDNYFHVKTTYEEGVDLDQHFEGVDCVLHLGAMMSWHPDDHAAMFDANVVATQEILRCAHKASVERFIFASSGEVYPENATQEMPITEDTPLNPTSFYGLTKRLGEELVDFYRRQGLETVILRFPHTQAASELLDPESFFSGPRFFLDPKIKQMEFFGKTEIVEKLKALRSDGSPKMILQYGEEDGKPYQMQIADVRDIVSGIRLAMTHPEAVGETFNLMPDEVVEFDKVLPRMAEITGLPLVKVFMPGRAIRYETSNSKIKEQLGYQPRHSFLSMVEEKR